MLKTLPFLNKRIFFNKIAVIFLFLGITSIFAQSSQHGASFNLADTINDTSGVFHDLKVADSVSTQISGIITEVCQAKGCWMNVKLVDGEQVFVKFRDYSFFVPTDAAGKKVAMNGKAFIEEMSVEHQQHYALDKGATKEEVASITQPKRTLRFEAEGVRISN